MVNQENALFFSIVKSYFLQQNVTRMGNLMIE